MKWHFCRIIISHSPCLLWTSLQGRGEETLAFLSIMEWYSVKYSLEAGWWLGMWKIQFQLPGSLQRQQTGRVRAYICLLWFTATREHKGTFLAQPSRQKLWASTWSRQKLWASTRSSHRSTAHSLPGKLRCTCSGSWVPRPKLKSKIYSHWACLDGDVCIIKYHISLFTLWFLIVSSDLSVKHWTKF